MLAVGFWKEMQTLWCAQRESARAGGGDEGKRELRRSSPVADDDEWVAMRCSGQWTDDPAPRASLPHRGSDGVPGATTACAGRAGPVRAVAARSDHALDVALGGPRCRGPAPPLPSLSAFRVPYTRARSCPRCSFLVHLFWSYLYHTRILCARPPLCISAFCRISPLAVDELYISCSRIFRLVPNFLAYSRISHFLRFHVMTSLFWCACPQPQVPFVDFNP